MEKVMKKLTDRRAISELDFLRNQVLKNAYGNDDTVIAMLDPRILLVWYVFFALAPWFVNDLVFLLGCFLLVAVTTIMARVAGLVLFLFILGVFSQTGYLFVVSLLFGGNAETILPLLILTLKVATVSLASITVFSGLDPDRLSQRPDVVRLSGKAFLFHFLCISYAPSAYGGVPECASVLQIERKCAGHRYPYGEDPVSDLPDQDDHPFFLSSYAEYRQAVTDNGGSPGDQGIPLRSKQ